MSLTFTLAWWHIGAALVATGILLLVTAPTTYSSFMGWSAPDVTHQHVIGILLVLLGAAYLILGTIARSFP